MRTFSILLSVFLFGILGSLKLSAQSETLIHSNYIYHENIKSVLLHRSGFTLSPPVIRMNSNEKLKLSFDDLEADRKDYTYTFVHCDADWQQSELQPYEFLDGFEENYIESDQSSFGTLIEYTHYELIIPNDDIEFLKAGNYMMKVFAEDDDEPAFTRRFYILDSKVNIGGTVHAATTIADRDFNQEVDFYIETGSINIMNPYQDLKVIVSQNFRWDNAIFDLQPKMIINNKLEYNYDFENNFEAGNEFRWFDIKTLKKVTPQINKIVKEYGAYNVFLELDMSRGSKNYISMDDINGQFLIKNEDYNDSELEGDYAYVHFKLYSPFPVDGDVYIYGQLTDWQINETSRMEYNYDEKVYEKMLLLKQGFYNYMYLVNNNYFEYLELTSFEGSHYETENQYTVFAYYRFPGEQYDRLIGIGYLNSVIE